MKRQIQKKNAVPGVRNIIRGVLSMSRLTRSVSPVLLGMLMMVATFGQSAHGAAEEKTKFRAVKTQFIAALGDPNAVSGTGAETWGIWRVDPGPRGVWLTNYEELKAANGIAPAKWKFNDEDWWVEEHGLIMEEPDFPLAPGKYVVTGDRAAVSILTIHPEDESGEHRWELGPGTTLYDVTHLPCRSARYSPADGEGSCSPTNADASVYPITPGAEMPAVPGCKKQDYAVLFVVAVEVKNQG
ncbi:MAG: hypothetical protein GKR95_11750 [Gammaproteobacteria bacterium]|nr:hypothetical protein [Gammaproteobacteria bacterium]